MDDESLAQVQEETTLTKIRVTLNNMNIKLWEAPYLNMETKAPVEEKLHELAVTLKNEVDLPLPYLFQGLQMLQKTALDKLAAREKFNQTGVAKLRVRCARGIKCKVKDVEISLNVEGIVLLEKLAEMTGLKVDNLQVITGGKVVKKTDCLKAQGLKNSSNLMLVKVGNDKSLKLVEEQRKILEDTKSDAKRLGGRKSHDNHSLQIADQSGKSIELPPAEKQALVIAMSLHEKGKSALKKKDYSLALVLLLEADNEFKSCRSDLLNLVDNYAILNLDIAWCYLCLQTVSELGDAEARLDACEKKFNESYGNNLERLAALKGSTGNESALLMRLHLLQGIVAFHQGRTREARPLLLKSQIEHSMLAVDENSLVEVAGMGYSIAEARLGLRTAHGDIKLAVDHIIRRREEKENIKKKEAEDLERERLREKLGQCADGSWVNVGYYKTLVGMGFTDKVAATALRQANNSLNLAVQMLQEEPDLIQLAAEDRPDKKKKKMEVTDEMVATVSAMGFEPDMAKRALQQEGDVEAAVQKLMASGGIIMDMEEMEAENVLKAKKQEDHDAYNRIKDDISTFEEDHLDLDLQEELEFLHKYLQLLPKN